MATALGFLLVVLRGPDTHRWSRSWWGNTLLVVGTAMVFAGTPAASWASNHGPDSRAAVPLASLAGLAWFYWVDQFIGMRALVVSLAVVVLLVPVAWMLIYNSPRGHRPLYLGTGIIFALSSSAILLRGVSMVAAGYNFPLFCQYSDAGVLLCLFDHVSGVVVYRPAAHEQPTPERRTTPIPRRSWPSPLTTWNGILDFLPDPTWVGGQPGTQSTHWNQAMERPHGRAWRSGFWAKANTSTPLPLYGERRPCPHRPDAQGTDPEGESRYQSLERRGDMLVTSESFLPKLGEAGLYVAGSATCLLDEQGQVSGAIETLRDVTQAKCGQQEREKLIAELTKALEKVKTLKGPHPYLFPLQEHPPRRGLLAAVGDLLLRPRRGGVQPWHLPRLPGKVLSGLQAPARWVRGGGPLR